MIFSSIALYAVIGVTISTAFLTTKKKRKSSESSSSSEVPPPRQTAQAPSPGVVFDDTLAEVSEALDEDPSTSCAANNLAARNSERRCQQDAVDEKNKQAEKYRRICAGNNTDDGPPTTGDGSPPTASAPIAAATDGSQPFPSDPTFDKRILYGRSRLRDFSMSRLMSDI